MTLPLESYQSPQGTVQSGRAQKNDYNNSQGKRFEGIYYNCGKKGHMSKDCWSKKKSVESNVASSNMEMEEYGMQRYFMP